MAKKLRIMPEMMRWRAGLGDRQDRQSLYGGSVMLAGGKSRVRPPLYLVAVESLALLPSFKLPNVWQFGADALTPYCTPYAPTRILQTNTHFTMGGGDKALFDS